MARWIAIAVLAALTGVLTIQAMTAHPVVMSRWLVLCLVAFFALGIVLWRAFSGWALGAGIALALCMLLAGYAGMAKIVLSRQDTRPMPQLTRRADDPGLGHTAVVYFTHGEPETYDPIGWLNQFREFDEQGIAFVPFLVRPIFVQQLRAAYLKVGRSDHVRMHAQMLASLERAYREAGDETTRFYLSFLDANPRPDAALVQALNDGASKVIVAEVFLTISNHTAEGALQIQSVVESEGMPDIPVVFTGPLWDSTTLRSMFVARANGRRELLDKSKIGVLLVGHGQPDEWDEEWPTETSQEIGFREEVLKLFERDGYDPGKLGIAWMEFKDPKPAELVESFVAHGAREILFFSAAISADSIHSQYDTPELVHKAKVPETISIQNLGAWNDDPIVIQAIKEKIDEHM